METSEFGTSQQTLAAVNWCGFQSDLEVEFQRFILNKGAIFSSLV